MSAQKMAVSVGVAFVLALLVARASADVGDAVAAGAAGGVAGGVAAGAARSPELTVPIIGPELRDWIDPRTGSTVKLGTGCGHVLEARLSGSGTRNLLNLTIQNHNDAIWSLDSRRVMAHFGRVRHGAFRRRWRPLAHCRQATLLTERLPFPRRRISRVRLLWSSGSRSCRSGVRPARPCSRSSVTPAWPTTREPMCRTCGSICTSGGGPTWHQPAAFVSSAESKGGLLEFGFSGFPALHHGWFFDIAIDVYGNKGVPAVSQGVTLGDNPRFRAPACLRGTSSDLIRRAGFPCHTG